MLNGGLSNDLAKSFAARLQASAGSDHERLVTLAFQWTVGRSPTPPERQRSLEFLRDEPLNEFALAMFNLNEFLYVP